MKKFGSIVLQALSFLGIPFVASVIINAVATWLGISEELTFQYIVRAGIYPAVVMFSVLLSVSMADEAGTKWFAYVGCAIGTLLFGIELIASIITGIGFIVVFGDALCFLSYPLGIFILVHAKEVLGGKRPNKYEAKQEDMIEWPKQ
ncbi:MAG TPA: hypothetical protein PKY19_03775 [Oscillospiraceae bacterium]|nr:hypothetical protein [Oscillospiraceae bacterium]HXK77586.1 hypothetical protein [Oscillospiraceae bacterium]